MRPNLFLGNTFKSQCAEVGLQKLEWTQSVGFYPHHGKPASIQFNGNRVIVTDNGGNRTIGTYKTHNGSIIVTIKGKTITGELIEDSELGLTLLQFTGKVLAINDFVTKIRFDNTSGCSD